MKNKVDKGSELVYWNLSYRRKFIRTLWQTPLVFLGIGFLILVGDNLFLNKIVPILLVIMYIWQLIHNYTKWKNDLYNKSTKKMYNTKMYTTKLNKYDYEFNIDMENTRLMYASRSESSINVHKQLPELVKFLNELGINIRKPDEYNSDFSDVVYTFIGTVKSQEGDEIDMYGENQYVSIVVYGQDGIGKLEVFGMTE